MTDLFIASRSIPHHDDSSRRVLVAGAFIDGEVCVQGPAGAAERIGRALKAGRRRRQADEMLLAALRVALAEPAGVEAVKRAGREAWETFQKQQRGETP